MGLLSRIRVYHFLLFGGNAFIHPFLGLFLLRAGLTGTEIGFVGTLMSMAGLVAAPAWGQWIDRHANTNIRTVLRIVLVASALLHIAISQQSTFFLLSLLLVINGLITASIFPLSNIFALELSGTERYGSIRLWGSMGWAILVLAGGWLIEQFGLIVGFLGYAVLFVAAAGILPSAARTQSIEPTTAKPGSLTMFRYVIRNRALFGLVIAVCLQNLTMEPVYRFEPIYLDELGATETLIGFASTIGALVELPVMLWADKLIGTQGAGRVLRLGLLIHMVRLIAVLLAPNMFVIVTMYLVHGVAYALIAVALVVFVSGNSPPQQATVIMALFMGTLPALTGIAGGPLGGMIYDTIGAYWLYAISLGGLVLAWIILKLTGVQTIAETSVAST